jgi:hypothetical protein
VSQAQNFVSEEEGTGTTHGVVTKAEFRILTASQASPYNTVREKCVLFDLTLAPAQLTAQEQN